MDRTAAALAVRAAIESDDKERAQATMSAAENLFNFSGLVSKHSAAIDAALDGNDPGEARSVAFLKAEIEAAYELRDAATKAIDALIDAVVFPAS